MKPMISKQQARLVALSIAKDIRAYVDDHPAEYSKFLEENYKQVVSSEDQEEKSIPA